MNADNGQFPGASGEAACGDGANGELIPEFRVVVAGGRRRGVRLERLYWQLLREIAERRGQKRSRLVARVIEDAGPLAENAASVLRGFVAETLKRERDTLAARAGEASLVSLLQQAPVPAFAINRQKKLQQINADFIQLLRVMSGNLSEKMSADLMQLTLDKPIDELFGLLGESGVTHCGYAIQLDDRRRRGRARIVAVPPAPFQIFVGYVVS